MANLVGRRDGVPGSVGVLVLKCAQGEDWLYTN